MVKGAETSHRPCRQATRAPIVIVSSLSSVERRSRDTGDERNGGERINRARKAQEMVYIQPRQSKPAMSIQASAQLPHQEAAPATTLGTLRYTTHYLYCRYLQRQVQNSGSHRIPSRPITSHCLVRVSWAQRNMYACLVSGFRQKSPQSIYLLPGKITEHTTSSSLSTPLHSLTCLTFRLTRLFFIHPFHSANWPCSAGQFCK